MRSSWTMESVRLSFRSENEVIMKAVRQEDGLAITRVDGAWLSEIT